MTTASSIREIQEKGYCVLRGHFPAGLIHPCREGFWPVLADYLAAHGDQPNRGACRHFLPMPFDPPCFTPGFFFDPEVLAIVRGIMGERIVADQWGCDVSLRGSTYQDAHIDFRRPLFEETPDLRVPAYILVVSFGLDRIAAEHGPIEIAPGTHRMPPAEALRAVKAPEIALEAVPLEIGDVLIRHPWALHRGTPNLTDRPRALASIRYVRRWYADDSREVARMSGAAWRALTAQQQNMMRFPIQVQ